MPTARLRYASPVRANGQRLGRRPPRISDEDLLRIADPHVRSRSLSRYRSSWGQRVNFDLAEKDSRMALVSLRFRHNRRLQAAATNSPPMKVAERDTDAVRILQQALHDVIRPNGSFGYSMPLTFKSGGPDGIYGNETFTAVVSFQKERLPEDRRAHDGQSGKKTLEELDRLFPDVVLGPAGATTQGATTPNAQPLRRTLPVKLRQVADAIHALTNQDRHFDDAAPVHVVVLHDSVQMAIIEREPTRTLQASVDRAVRTLPGAVRAVVNGSFGAHTLPGVGGPQPLAAYGLSGFVVRNGRPLAPRGTSDSVNSFLAFTGSGQYHFGTGNTPMVIAGRSVVAGLGALLPIVRDGSAVENGFVRVLAARGAIGRVIVGHAPHAHRIVIVVQKDRGATEDLETLRDFVLDLGCREAVGLDGSDSAMLRCGCHSNHLWVVENAFIKNNICVNAVAFVR